jgi:Ca2+-binding RTX toxin-like protein
MRSGRIPRPSFSVQRMKRPVLAAVALAVAAAAPATASAASLDVAVPGGVPTIVYTASPGEINALEMHGTVNGGLDFRMPFFEFSAPLTLGAGCTAGTPVLCGPADHALPVSVSLGDRDDVASTNSFTEDLAMDAGSGDDDVLAGGVDVTADGGSGDDTVVLAANSVSTGTGGSGRDRLTATLGTAAASLDGGTGGDLLVPDGFATNNAEGGSGNDALINFNGMRTTLSGGSGSDVLVAPPARHTVTLDGGSGNDIAYGHAGGVTVTMGPGYDVVDVRGGSETSPDTVACGSGLDAVWADADDTVAGDCELVFRTFAAPSLRRVTAARTAGQALLAHRPDPSAA